MIVQAFNTAAGGLKNFDIYMAAGGFGVHPQGARDALELLFRGPIGSVLLWLLAFALARRYPLGANHWYGRLALHVVASIAFAVAKIFLDYPVIKFCYCPAPEKLTLSLFLKSAFTGYFFRYVLFSWAMIGIAHALDYYGKYRDGELRSAHLEAGLARARLQLLKSQLQPHFLFNTLNAVSALVQTDVEAADRVLARLGELLRLTLEDFDLQESPLARELDVVRAYLDIEQARLGPRLCVHQEIASDGAFSLGMIAEFGDTIRTLGAWWYRRLFWEAGVLGQVLYLEAEAAGVRGTGIGHALLRQSLTTLRDMGCYAASLTVTDANREAVALYERVGFHTVRQFSAYAWEGF